MFTTSNTALRTIFGTIGTVICAGVCLVAATAPAQAANAAGITTVSLLDLNLASDQGRDALNTRIKSAARSVCANGSDDVRARRDEARCVHEAINRAQTRVVDHGYRGR